MTLLLIAGDTPTGKLVRSLIPDCESVGKHGGVIHRDGRYSAMVICDERIQGKSLDHFKDVAARHGIDKVITMGVA